MFDQNLGEAYWLSYLLKLKMVSNIMLVLKIVSIICRVCIVYVILDVNSLL